MGFAQPAVDAASESYPLNVEELLGRCLGRLDLAERILRKFQNSLEADVEQLEQAVRQSDCEQVAQLAHRIKGASLAVSAGGVTACARRMEESATTGCAEDLPGQLEELKQATRRFEDLPALPQSGGSSR